MTLARWYPTLVSLKGGRVLSVSGLDQFGRIIKGDNEIYDPADEAVGGRSRSSSAPSRPTRRCS